MLPPLPSTTNLKSCFTAPRKEKLRYPPSTLYYPSMTQNHLSPPRHTDRHFCSQKHSPTKIKISISHYSGMHLGFLAPLPAINPTPVKGDWPWLSWTVLSLLQRFVDEESEWFHTIYWCLMQMLVESRKPAHIGIKLQYICIYWSIKPITFSLGHSSKLPPTPKTTLRISKVFRGPWLI